MKRYRSLTLRGKPFPLPKVELNLCKPVRNCVGNSTNYSGIYRESNSFVPSEEQHTTGDVRLECGFSGFLKERPIWAGTGLYLVYQQYGIYKVFLLSKFFFNIVTLLSTGTVVQRKSDSTYMHKVEAEEILNLMKPPPNQAQMNPQLYKKVQLEDRRKLKRKK
jgi:hypothetical protein